MYDSFLSHASFSKETTHILQCNKAREVHFRLNMKQSSRIFICSVEVSPCIIKQTCRAREKKKTSCTDVFHICCRHFCAARRMELVVTLYSEILNTFRVCLFFFFLFYFFLPTYPEKTYHILKFVSMAERKVWVRTRA